uniref:Metalloendopeptidase n=1 Tax=Magallana gigas TaxID=29159 RepID=A0A8W8NGI7_MAGGI|nr:MAM and LDL-receptor class A domain-containing protein 1-like [Crassostrea gigas]
MTARSTLVLLFVFCVEFGCVFSENVVWDDNFKRPLKVYTKPRSLIEVVNERRRRYVAPKSKKGTYKDLIGHGGSVIDRKAYDPDSVIAGILAGMFVERNGVERTPNVDFQRSRKFRGQQLDTHKLTHRQKVIYGLESENSNDMRIRRKRNFVSDNNSLWPRGVVPYQLDGNMSPDAVDVVKAGIEMLHNMTCVRFAPIGSQLANSVSHSNHVYFFSQSGCWSYVGMIGWGRQEISLQDPGCISLATSVHEICHALGMWHEQNRSDRDSKIELYGDNISGGGLNNVNFRRMTTRNSYPYDISSVLQYSLTSFAVDRSRPTMRSKDPRLAFLADKATGLMYYDAKEITKVYSCTQNCVNPPNCDNGGYLNQNCQCQCPAGLTGSDCRSVVSSPGCGGVISLSANEEAKISSSNYPNKYSLGEECVWLVKGPPDHHIQMTIDFMDISDNGYDACYHWLEVRYNLMGQDGPELCGLRRDETFYSSHDEMENVMMLKFNSAISSDKAPSTGFRLTVRSIGKSCVDHPCKFGECYVTDTSYRCQCQSGFVGTNCDEFVGRDMYLFSNFDNEELNFLQNVDSDDFDWTLHSGSTPSSATGPQSAKSGQYYMYIEASAPRSEGDKAILSSEIVKFSSVHERCLRFSYHMYGSAIGSLAVYFQGNSTNKTLAFQKIGDQGNQWNSTEIDIPPMQNLQIIIEGVRGSSYDGDIAIDAIELRSHNCSTTLPPTTTGTTRISTESDPPTTPITTPFIGDKASINVTDSITPTSATQAPLSLSVTCDFETGNTCFLENLEQTLISEKDTVSTELQKDDFDWTLHSGPTPSSDTGPAMAYRGSRYAFIEASSPRKDGDKAIMRSTNTFRETVQCLSFSYHMYGKTSGMGKLNVYYTAQNGSIFRIFSRIGNLGDAWRRESMQIPPTRGLQIYFEGIRGIGYRSDVAIDDIIVSEGECGCAARPCQHGGVCHSLGGSSYNCSCVGAYGGTHCEELVSAISCSFDDGLCGFLTQSTDDDYDWQFGTYTRSRYTGPQTPLDGRFAYTEASFKARGSTSILTTAGTQLAFQDWCFSFSYYMYGYNMGALAVRAGYSGLGLPYRWFWYGNKGARWEHQSITIHAIPRLVIEIMAVRGWGYRSDMAVDNISLTPGTC